MTYRLVRVFCLILVFVAACTPNLRPLYIDYQVGSLDTPVLERIESAFGEAGWIIAEDSLTNTVRTELQHFQSWGLYTIVAYIEAVPVNDRYVRLFIHPYRYYFTGARSKIPYFKGGVRRAILRDLEPALANYNLVAVGTDLSRDGVRRQ